MRHDEHDPHSPRPPKRRVWWLLLLFYDVKNRKSNETQKETRSTHLKQDAICLNLNGEIKRKILPKLPLKIGEGWFYLGEKILEI